MTTALTVGDRPLEPGNLSLNDVLAKLGYTTKKATAAWSMYSKEIRKNDTVVFTGDSTEVWEWLRESKQIK